MKALQQEGVDCSSGYRPLYDYALFKEFPKKASGYNELYAGRTYTAVDCPVCERVCQNESLWFFQEMMLGPKTDMEDIARAIEKIQQYADEALES